MTQLLHQIRSITKGPPQCSFVNQPDGSVMMCLCHMHDLLLSKAQEIYCATSAATGQDWSVLAKVPVAAVPNGTVYANPPTAVWDGKSSAASAGMLYPFYPLGIFSAPPAAWNGTQFVWEHSKTHQVWPINGSFLDGGAILGMIRLTTAGAHRAGRMLTTVQHDTHGIVYLYSDDGGHHWQQSTNNAIIIGDYYGGCEPNSVELSNGTILTFIRASVHPSESVLWIARSVNGGTSFEGPPTPSNLISFQSPTMVLRVDGNSSAASATPSPIILVFNNARPTADSVSGETYRAILHAAISVDDGDTWRGFREVMRDDAIKGSSDVAGDHGTAYPEGAITADGSVIFESGQGAAHWSAMKFSPQWLLKTSASADWTSPSVDWDNVTNFAGSYASGCTARPGEKAGFQGRVVGCPKCTGAQFDPQMHRNCFFQPDIHSSRIWSFPSTLLPNCSNSICASKWGFNPCTVCGAIEPESFGAIQLANWQNASGFEAWLADPKHFFDCSMLISSGRLPCSQHDGVALRAPRASVLPRWLSSQPSLALCAAMDADASSAGFSWNFPSSRKGLLRLRLLLEAADFTGAQLALSDHWEPPWHDRTDPTVAVFLLDIPGPAGLSGLSMGSFFDLSLAWDVDARVASWSVINSSSDGVKTPNAQLNTTRAKTMSIGAGGVNYLTVKAAGPGGVCVATVDKHEIPPVKSDDNVPSTRSFPPDSVVVIVEAVLGASGHGSVECAARACKAMKTDDDAVRIAAKTFKTKQ
jgi:hypothetical protein